MSREFQKKDVVTYGSEFVEAGQSNHRRFKLKRKNVGWDEGCPITTFNDSDAHSLSYRVLLDSMFLHNYASFFA